MFFGLLMLILCVFLVYAMVTNPASTGNVLEAMLVCMTTILGIYSLVKGGLTGFELYLNKDLKEEEKTEKKKKNERTCHWWRYYASCYRFACQCFSDDGFHCCCIIRSN